MESLLFAKDDEAFLKGLGLELQKIFRPGGSVALKLHMGEKNNPNHLQPGFVKKVADALKKTGTRPFLFDSPAVYRTARDTVRGYEKQCKELGFTEQAIGCPVVISNDYIEVKGGHFAYQVCRHLAEADGVLALTHFKGHACCGLGGSIKNLGMGALSRESKGDIHNGSKPELAGGCILCRKCSEVCPAGSIEYDEAGPKFDYDACYGCSKCIQNCPQKCLRPRVAEFDILLAEGAAAALSSFKKAYFVNVMRNIMNRCDCQTSDLKRVLPDIGILMGRDIVAIDKASIDMVNQGAGRKIFDEIWHKDSEMQIREAERLGMGDSEYAIKKI